MGELYKVLLGSALQLREASRKHLCRQVLLQFADL